MGGYEPGDKVLISGEVLETRAGVGVKVELFSKTDQYATWIREDQVTRTGVVLDLPLNDVTPKQMADFLLEVLHGCNHPWADHIADQIIEQTRPAIPEPTGLGAVVVDVTGDHYVRRCPGSCEDGGLCIPWSHVKTGNSVTWSQITPAEVLSEGVQVG